MLYETNQIGNEQAQCSKKDAEDPALMARKPVSGASYTRAEWRHT